jgi:uncharacterized protein
VRISPQARLVIGAIKAYKWLLSPLFAGSCRYLPSCSEYMTEAVVRHGAVAGVALGASRICRCQPFGGSGLDPVPLKISARAFFGRNPAGAKHVDSKCPADHVRQEA